jgi:hypothetical protein
MTDLHTLAVATDTLLAELYVEAEALRSERQHTLEAIHHAAGDSKKRTAGRYQFAPWTLSHAEAIAAEPATPWNRDRHADSVTRLDSLDRRLADNARKASELAAIWEANGKWARFFMVSAGHIHRSMDCSTCNNGQTATSFGWLPQLSGLTEADAVKAHGALLCTVCYPSAPVEWTNGKELEAEAKAAALCPGSRKGAVPDPARRNLRYGKCQGCGSTQALTTRGAIRAHKPAKAKANA